MIPGYLAGALRDRPLIPGYQWRARVYPHAVRANERAEAEHGTPVPTCAHCGGPVRYADRPGGGECAACGRPPLSAAGSDDGGLKAHLDLLARARQVSP